VSSASVGFDAREAPWVDAVKAMAPTNAKISARIFTCLKDLSGQYSGIAINKF
jgi:hypothetical protein